MNIAIRNWKMEDADVLANMLNNKNVLDNLNDGIPFPYTISDANDFISGLSDLDRNNVFIWAITANETIVGGVSVFRRENVRRLTAEIGYYLAEEYWGKGIMVQAIKQACEYIFQNTDIVRIFAEPFCTNQASHRVLEKSGFTYESTLKMGAVKNNYILDTKCYVLIKE